MTTTNLGLTLPTVGASADTWGGLINTVLTEIDSLFNIVGWANLSAFTHAYVGATQFKVTGANLSLTYHVGRRVKAVGVLTGTIYGTISTVAFSTDTTVTVTWDSGSLSNETLTIYLCLIPVTGAATGTGKVVLAGSPTLNGTVNFLASPGGANVGNITNDGSGLYITSASSDFHLGASGTYVSIGSAGGFVPVVDNTMSCGTAAQRWAIVYATNGTINTSDERYKDWYVPQTDYRQKIKDLWVGDYFRFDDITHTKGRVRELGIRAQQADKVLDGLMIESPADETGIWGVKSHMPGNLALWGVKDIYALIESLADRIAVLEAKEKA